MGRNVWSSSGISIERAATIVEETAAELALNPFFQEGGIPGATLALELTRVTGIQLHLEFGYRKLKDFIVNHCPGLRVSTSQYGDMRVRVSRQLVVEAPIEDGHSDVVFPQCTVEWIGALIRNQPHRRGTKDLGAVIDDYAVRLHIEPDALSYLLGAAINAIERGQHGVPALRTALHALSRRLEGRRQYVAALELRLAAFAAGFESEQDEPGSCVRLAVADVDPSLVEEDGALPPQALTSEVKQALAALVARAGQYSSELALAVVGGKGPLYFAVRTHVASVLSSGSRGAAEHLIFDEHASEMRSRLSAAREAVERHVEVSPSTQGADFQKVLAPIAKLKAFMLPSEVRHWNDVTGGVSALGRLRDTVSEKGTTLSPPLVGALRQGVDTLRELCVVAMHDGPMLHSTIVRLGERIAEDTAAFVSDLSIRVRANVRLRDVSRKYPIGRVNEEIAVPFEILNDGPGVANNVRVVVSADPGVQVDDGTLHVGTLRPHQPSPQSLAIRTIVAMRSVRISLAIIFQDDIGGDRKCVAELLLDAQTRETDWASLLATRPYTLNPVERRAQLWGRNAQLNRLLLNIATATSSVVWGQKRVGKTSVARVLYNELQVKPMFLPLYLRKGDVAGFDEGQLGHEVAERLVATCERVRGMKFRTVVPSVAEFSGRINRLTRVIDDLRDAGLLDTVVLILDEFDEMNHHFYFGDRGETFFGVLRALTERNVVLILIGSERMPAIIDRYSQLLNKYDMMRIDCVDNRADAFQLIEEPVRGHIDFDGAAKNRLFELSTGNPYYINLLCREILREMVDARRSYVDLADVQSAAALLCGEPASPHWSHLWEDSESYTPAERQRLSGDFAKVLLAFACWPLEVSLSAGELRASLGEQEGAMTFSLEQVLVLLAKRGIVVSEQRPVGHVTILSHVSSAGGYVNAVTSSSVRVRHRRRGSLFLASSHRQRCSRTSR
ncbi:MAG: hypothetical protein JNK64_18735 [Myxococcales bacterium]|nr:hypothetical protein [Myxococcales bacterium]